MKWLIFFSVVSYCVYDGQWAMVSNDGGGSSTLVSVSAYSTLTLSTLGKSQLAILDGAEWNSVRNILKGQQELESSPSSSSMSTETNSAPFTRYGYMTIVTGKDENNRRIVAMQCMDNGGDINTNNNPPRMVYKDSVAAIPQTVSDEDAISTYTLAFSSIHCALPRIENIGGSNDSIVSTGKVVVLGSSDLACFSAEGLASMGMEVFMVNNKGNANVKKDIGNLNIIKPAVGDSETAFSSHLGQFDSLVDTIGNERLSSYLDFDDDNDDEYGGDGTSFGGSTLNLLRNQHNCNTYVSTLCHSQSLVESEGIFFGPRKVDEHCEKIGSISFMTKSRECESIHPPKAVGETLEILMKNNIIFTEKQRKKTCSKRSDAVRGWNLSDFLEQSLWPRDTSGSGKTRFGLPVKDNLDDDIFDDDEILISEAPYQAEANNKRARATGSELDEYGFPSSSVSSPSSNPKNRAVQNNSYVLNIMDVEGMKSEIVNTKKTGILFMSAKFCKTCKTINPAFIRMARIDQENNNAQSMHDISFVKCETSGASGKELAKYVSVRAVPSFVFVREGQILGQASVSKLPSSKIDKGIQLLKTEADWDYSILDDEERSLK